MGKIEQTVGANSVSRISAGTFFKGEIESPFDLRIDGEFEGKLHSKGRVVIGEGAKVNGEIMCENVDLWGTMSGTLYVKDTMSLKGGCSMDGAMHIRKLIVELGASFNGNCRMITEEEYDKLAEKPKAAQPLQGAPAAGAETGSGSGSGSGSGNEARKK